MKQTRFTALFTGLLLMAVLSAPVLTARAELTPPLPDLTGIVKNKDWAIVLGKAFFWDQQVGSDGASCASCHFHAGADIRIKNQLTPGFLDITAGPDGDTEFGSTYSDTGEILPGEMPSGALAGPNYTLTPEDMPLHVLADETDRDSDIVTTTNDRVASSGSFDSIFSRVRRHSFFDICSEPEGDVFHAGGHPARQVEPRQTPTVINAVLNHRSFWDGRATNMFNGVGVFGMRDILEDPKARILVSEGWNDLELTYLTLENASTASQAVGPPLSELEMSCQGRTFPDIGRKMLYRRPLELQEVHWNDSLLGRRGPFGDLREVTRLGFRPGPVWGINLGLDAKHTYASLIRRAFDDKYWRAKGKFKITEDGELKRVRHGGYTQMELNFSMFWGIAIMLYQSTLISDQSEFDTLIAEGKLVLEPNGPGNRVVDTTGGEIDELLIRGAQIFFGAPFGPPPNGAGCLFCHGAPTFSENAIQAGEDFNIFLTVGDVNGVTDIRDRGFANIGIRPTFSDLILGGTDPYGYPLSFGRQYIQGQVVDQVLQTLIDENGVQANIANGTVTKLESDGASKIPTLRNVALTPPYFSWGGYDTLRDVMKVYNRGANRRTISNAADPDAHGTGCTSGDDTGSGPDGDTPYADLAGGDCNTNTTGLIVPLGLEDCDPNGLAVCDETQDDLAALVRLMKSLTDSRVQRDQAPFDHPSLFVFHGHYESDWNRDGRADSILFKLPAVGAAGYAPQSGFCIPNAGDLFAPGMRARAGGERVPLVE